MATRYRLKSAIPAMMDSPAGRHQQLSVMLPAGAVLLHSFQASTTLLGMIGAYWEGRHYSVSLRDLLKKAERVSTA
jgi:hypothetical protein